MMVENGTSQLGSQKSVPAHRRRLLIYFTAISDLFHSCSELFSSYFSPLLAVRGMRSRMPGVVLLMVVTAGLLALDPEKDGALSMFRQQFSEHFEVERGRSVEPL